MAAEPPATTALEAGSPATSPTCTGALADPANPYEMNLTVLKFRRRQLLPDDLQCQRPQQNLRPNYGHGPGLRHRHRPGGWQLRPHLQLQYLVQRRRPQFLQRWNEWHSTRIAQQQHPIHPQDHRLRRSDRYQHRHVERKSQRHQRDLQRHQHYRRYHQRRTHRRRPGLYARRIRAAYGLDKVTLRRPGPDHRHRRRPRQCEYLPGHR